MTLGLLMGTSALAEPPGVWFLNARQTGPDMVYFTVGGTQTMPPMSFEQVLLAWRWSEDGDNPFYPNGKGATYQFSDRSGKKAESWAAGAEEVAFPVVVVGSDRELLLSGAESEEVQLWVDLLDGIEAAYRQSMKDIDVVQRFEVLPMGTFGECVVRSGPLKSAESSLALFDLPGGALPSREGGYNYVDPAAVTDSSKVKTIRISRFSRWIEGPISCLGPSTNQTLRLFPMPETRSDFFLNIRSVEIDSGITTPGPGNSKGLHGPWLPWLGFLTGLGLVVVLAIVLLRRRGQGSLPSQSRESAREKDSSLYRILEIERDLNVRMEQLSSRVCGESESRVHEMQPRLNEMQARLDEMQARLDEMRAGLDEMRAGLGEYGQ